MPDKSKSEPKASLKPGKPSPPSKFSLRSLLPDSYKLPFYAALFLFVLTLIVAVLIAVSGLEIARTAEMLAKSYVDVVEEQENGEGAEADEDEEGDTAATPPPPPACADQTVDIRFGTFTLPCDWHSYFEFQPVEERSSGFFGSDPLLLLGSSDAPVGDGGVSVRVFSTALGNYTADPLSAEMTMMAGGEGVTITDITSAKGIAFKKVNVSGGMLTGNPTDYYYAQKVVSGTEVWMVIFANNPGGTAAEGPMNSFEWDN